MKNLDWFKSASWQYLLPQHMISKIFGKFSNIELAWIKNPQIKQFINRYGVNMNEALIEDINLYPNFNAFFTRHLKPGIRAIQEGFTSPADGTLSEFGKIENKKLIQAKDKAFSLKALLGNPSEDLIKPFINGDFCTIYLSPKDYHRVHMPINGTLKTMRFIPGRLFSVSTNTAQHIDNLFARNERLVCYFETEIGPVALILVGAIIVGSMATSWAGTVKPSHNNIEQQNYPITNERYISLQKGDEMGYFHVGSTVIMLTSKDAIQWKEGIQKGMPLKMGQSIANLK